MSRYKSSNENKQYEDSSSSGRIAKLRPLQSDSEFYLKAKQSLIISHDQPILNKNEASLPLHLFH